MSYPENTMKNSQKSRPRVKIREKLLKLQRNRCEEKFSQSKGHIFKKINYSQAGPQEKSLVYIFLSNWLYFAAGWNTELQSKWDELSFFQRSQAVSYGSIPFGIHVPPAGLVIQKNLQGQISGSLTQKNGMTFSLPESQDKSEALDKILISDNFSCNSSSSEIFRMEESPYYHSFRMFSIWIWKQSFWYIVKETFKVI